MQLVTLVSVSSCTLILFRIAVGRRDMALLRNDGDFYVPGGGGDVFVNKFAVGLFIYKRVDTLE